MNIHKFDSKSNYQKMISGQCFSALSEDLFEKAALTRSKMEQFALIPRGDYLAKEALLRDIFGAFGTDVILRPPFSVDFGKHLFIGDWVSINFGAVFLDYATISIGDRTLVGPNVQFITISHPVDPDERLQAAPNAPYKPYRHASYAKPIVIGKDCWIGAAVVILPGVTIGDGTTIGAGSVVTKDIPSRVIAAGNPARVIRKID